MSFIEEERNYFYIRLYFKKWRKNFKSRHSLTKLNFGRKSIVDKCVSGNGHREIAMIVSTGSEEDMNVFAEYENASNRGVESIGEDKNSKFPHTFPKINCLRLSSEIDSKGPDGNQIRSSCSQQKKSQKNEIENLRIVRREEMKKLSENNIIEISGIHKDGIENGMNIPVSATVSPNENIGRNSLSDNLTDLQEKKIVIEEVLEKLKKEKENNKRRERISRAIHLQNL